ncbi:FAD-dependent oxidoreductase [uncultured Dysgonomonas sp.]|uniref:FAD dependent oxidoreductase n=1 Tax=uncultured Dysgonomonas sp. TaxID=206096 RepID=A0A212JCT4_9BACT|nr:FAD-dependent oxidoreductase [uncultured Dysgonomonas sp.]SBV97273.1 conserved exported hypothetical protein [uncultured Dysgonomonas sp.]
MIKEDFNQDKRNLKKLTLTTNLVVVGGGLSGVCAAIAAARAGIKVVLIQDRPVLGGNASSEVRLWVLGATSHMGSNNRWSREGGIIDEILLENLYKNKEGNPVIFDTILLDKVQQESNIQLLLNTSVYETIKSEKNRVSAVLAFNSQNSIRYEIAGTLFCDASGDGIVAYQAGAAYRMGAEDKLEYNEKFAPDTSEYGELLGHSLYFYTKNVGNPIKYVAPSYALKDIKKIPRFGNINSGQHGCKFWWLEYGGRLDTIHDTEKIKWELWSIVCGVWDYIKNSGKFPEADNLTLEWVGTIPGKRESRRFVGLYTLVQQDIMEQRHHDDAVLFGGWAIDLHPADGVYSEKGGCIQYHSKGVYEIPYRCFVSKDIENLFFAGRNISSSHVAHGSSRVMATSAFGGQAVGIAAAQCIKKGLKPKDIIDIKEIKELQQQLNIIGQSIPNTRIENQNNLLASANISVSSELILDRIREAGIWINLDYSVAQMLPLKKGQCYSFEIQVDAAEETILEVELRCSSKINNYTPDIVVDKLSIELVEGKQSIKLIFNKGLPNDQYGFLTFLKNDKAKIEMSEDRFSGIVSVFNKFNYAVNNNGAQIAPPDSGIESFEFWCPDRRPQGHNIAMKIVPALKTFGKENLLEGLIRPTNQPNAWASDISDKEVCMSVLWESEKEINSITLYFDTDYDHALESVQMGHPENIIPFCVQNYRIKDQTGNIIYEKIENYQTINVIKLGEKIKTSSITIELDNPQINIPVSVYYITIN